MAKGEPLQLKEKHSKPKLKKGKKQEVDAYGWPVLKKGRKEKQTEAQRAAIYVSRQISALAAGRPVVSMKPTPGRS